MARKERVLQIRISDKLYKQLQDAAGNRTDGNISEYVRMLILSQDNRTNPAIQKELIELRKEVNKVGVNINQITKNNNSGLYLDRDKEDLISGMNYIQNMFNALISEVNKS